MSEYTPKQWIINNLFTSKKLKKLGEVINGLVDKVDTVPSVNETAKVQYLTSQDGAITVGQNETPMYLLDDTDVKGNTIYFTDQNYSDVPFDELYNAVVNNKKININIYTSNSGTGTTEVGGKAFVCGSTAYFDDMYQSEPDTTKAIVVSGTLMFKKGSGTIAKTFTYYTDESMSTIDQSDDTKYVRFIRVEDEQSANADPFNIINVTTTWKSGGSEWEFKITSFPSYATLQNCVANGKPILVKEHFDASLFSTDTVALAYVQRKNSENTQFYIEYISPEGRYSVELYGNNGTATATLGNLGGLLPYHDQTMSGKVLTVASDGSLAWV
jgi:hypothetical protein